MIGGPQILSAIFLATSENWRRNSLAFVGGAAVSISLVVGVTYLLGTGPIEQRAPTPTRTAIVLTGLLLVMVHTYRNRAKSGPPQWMEKLKTATPWFSFRLGFLLLGFFPTDILTSITVGAYLAAQNSPPTDAVPFVLLTLLVLSLPSLTLIAFGERAERFLPKARDCMDANSWIVTELVLLVFMAIALNNFFA